MLKRITIIMALCVGMNIFAEVQEIPWEKNIAKGLTDVLVENVMKNPAAALCGMLVGLKTHDFMDSLWTKRLADGKANQTVNNYISNNVNVPSLLTVGAMIGGIVVAPLIPESVISTKLWVGASAMLIAHEFMKTRKQVQNVLMYTAVGGLFWMFADKIGIDKAVARAANTVTEVAPSVVTTATA